jgi:alpha-tubulin suppressor-like RCC1 family protein
MNSVRRAVLSAATVIAVAAMAGPAQAAITGHPAGRPTAASPTLWAWGDNPWGQLGNGTTAAAMIPSAVELPPGVTVTGVAGGLNHGLAVTSTGGVLSWGKNFLGALGDGTQAGSKTPVPVAIPAGVKVTAVRAGCSESLALTAAGQLLAWGQNPYGELGNGTTTASDVPVPVTLPPHTSIAEISAGCFTNVALTSTGRVLQWGRRLGDQASGSVGHVPTFVRFPAKVTITSIAVGPEEAYAVSSTGQVYVWNTGRPFRVPMPPRSKFGTITEVSTTDFSTLGLTSRGIVLTWNSTSLTDDPNPAPPVVAVKVLIPPNLKVTAIAADGPAGEGTTYYALTSNGQVYAWGSDLDGALGDGDGPDTNVPLRVEIPVGLTPAAIAVGGYGPTPFAFAVTRP